MDELNNPATAAELAAELNHWDILYESLDDGVRTALYHHYRKEPGPEVGPAEAARAAFLLDPARSAAVEGWSKREVTPKDRRRLELWQRLIQIAQVRDVAPIRDLRTELNAEIVAFRPSILGTVATRTEVTECLRTDPDRARRRSAWEAYRPLSEALDGRARELLRRRNRQAQALGHPNYVDLSLSLEDLNRTEVEGWLAAVDRYTRPLWTEMVQEGAHRSGIETVEPWDIPFLVDRSDLMPDSRFPRKEMIARQEQMRRRIGVPEGMPIRFEFVEVPFGGLTNFLKIPGDMRILMNPADGIPWYVTLFHEYGHALHNASIAQESFILRKEYGVNAVAFSEGMAQTSAYFVHSPRWLAETAGIAPAELPRFWHARNGAWIYRLRYLLYQVAFEWQAYDRVDGDLDTLLAETEAEYLLTAPRTIPRWAASSFYSIYPIYQQNYVVADMIASQVHAALRHDLGEPYGDGRTYGWLRERLYAPGATHSWKQLVHDATGHALDPAALGKDLTQ